MQTKKYILSVLTAITLAAVSAPQTHAAGYTQNTNPATVQLWIDSLNTACAGVFVGPSVILTAKHCVVRNVVNPTTNQAETHTESNIRVYKSNAGSNNHIAIAEVLWSHNGSTRNNPDIAILRTINYTTWDYAPIANVPPNIDDKLQICGVSNRANPWGSVGESYCGEATMTSTTNYPTDYILSKPLQTGNRDSGGPAYNSRGQVVGITHGDDYQSNYSTPLQNDVVRYRLSLYGAEFQ